MNTVHNARAPRNPIAEDTHIAIACPLCASPYLVVRTNTKTGGQFAGCPSWPDCSYTTGIPQAVYMRLSGQPTLFPMTDEERAAEEHRSHTGSDAGSPAGNP